MEIIYLIGDFTIIVILKLTWMKEIFLISVKSVSALNCNAFNGTFKNKNPHGNKE